MRAPDAQDDLDELYIRYDQEKVTVEELIDLVKKFDLTATVKTAKQ